MIKKELWLFVSLLCAVPMVSAQTNEFEYKEKYRLALNYLEGTDSIQRDSLKVVTLLET